nr:hypothetical protein [uncultured Rhodoferax sp.]
MADYKINPKFAETLQKSAGAMVSQKVGQLFSPKMVLDIQRILQAGDFLQGALGLGQNVEDLPQPLLGGISLAEARDIYSQLNNANLARKNLFFIQIEDSNPPKLNLTPRSPAAATAGSTLNQALNAMRDVTGGGLAGMVSNALGGSNSGGKSLSDPSVGFLMNLFATSVSYAPNTMTGERVHFGAVSMDKLTGTEPTEMQITTMDDEVGTLKRWFDAKFSQAAHTDGTFGLPNEYCVNIAVYHAVPKADDRAYKFHARMRPQTIQHELARSDQAMQEIQMTFQQFDTFFAP